MLRAARSQLATQEQLASFDLLLNRLPIFPDLSAAAFRLPRIYQLARTHALTAYDATGASGVTVLGRPHGLSEPIPHYG